MRKAMSLSKQSGSVRVTVLTGTPLGGRKKRAKRNGRNLTSVMGGKGQAVWQEPNQLKEKNDRERNESISRDRTSLEGKKGHRKSEGWSRN